jgi:hypothetical protein
MPPQNPFRITARVNRFDENTWWMVDLDREPRPTQGATPLVRRCMNAYGWSEEYARKVSKAYEQFLCIKKVKEDWNAEILSPSVSVDQMWHQHILDNVNYNHDSMLLCGHIVGHNPDGMYDRETKRQRREATANALLENFDRDRLDMMSEGVWSQVFEQTNEQPGGQEAQTNEQPQPGGQEAQTNEQPQTGGQEAQINEQPQPGGQEAITIFIQDYTSEKMFYSIRMTTLMGRVFDKYAAQKGVAADSLRFLLDAERIDPTATPRMLELVDQDGIYVVLEQGGC